MNKLNLDFNFVCRFCFNLFFQFCLSILFQFVFFIIKILIGKAFVYRRKFKSWTEVSA